jgi:D-erythrose 4-phosphate dehydrogenase
MPQPRPYKVALNGYGRIGRCVLRALFERGEKAGLNDLADRPASNT